MPTAVYQLRVMEPSIFKYILKHTLKDQIFILLLTAVSLPFVYLSLEIPKRIINQAIGGANIPDSILGFSITQISYLFLLSGIYLALVLLNGGLKYVINVYRGVVGERMLRRFRYTLYCRILRFPLPHFKRVSQGEIIPMVTAETEPLGGFIGDAFALPAFQGGLLLTYLVFIFNQDWILGLAAIALYPPQIYLIPKLQSKVNALAKKRVRAVRTLADGIGESIAGATEIHAHDTSHFERAKIADKLGRIFHIRYEIYKRKFFIKFLNNFLAILTPIFFYAIGGYFVIIGNLSLGALIAVIAAYKDLSSPWKELLKFYQITEDVRVKYGQIIEQFDPPNMLAQTIQDERPEQVESLAGELVANNVAYGEDEYVKSVDGVSVKLDFSEQIGIIGLTGSGKDELSQLIGRLLLPTAGRIRLNEMDWAELPQAITGQRVAYAGSSIYLFNDSIAANLLYPLQHKPVCDRELDSNAARERELDIAHALASGNSTDDIEADWTDYNAAGLQEHSELIDRVMQVLELLELDEDMYQLGLRAKVDALQRPDLVEKVMDARRSLRDRLRNPEIAALVEFFDRNTFNTNMTIAENLLFGSPVNGVNQLDELSSNPSVTKMLKETGLYDDFIEMGHKIGELMLELFADVDPDSDLFERFSFIHADDLPVYGSIIKRAADGLASLPEEDRQLLLSLPFKLIPARHRLGLIDNPMQIRLLDARRELQHELNGIIVEFNLAEFNPALSIQDNILFGKLAYGQAHGSTRVGQLISETVSELGLRRDIIRAGLDYQAGIGGARLSLVQRQKIGLARCLIKNPDLLVVNETTSALDPGSETRVVENICNYFRGRGIFWVLGRAELASNFDRVVIMQQGKIVENGLYQDLAKNSAAFAGLLNGD